MCVLNSSTDVVCVTLRRRDTDVLAVWRTPVGESGEQNASFAESWDFSFWLTWLMAQMFPSYIASQYFFVLFLETVFDIKIYCLEY